MTDNYLNISTQQNRGIDIDAIYKHEFSSGNLTLRGQAAYQLEDEVKLLPTSDPLDGNGRSAIRNGSVTSMRRSKRARSSSSTAPAMSARRPTPIISVANRRPTSSSHVRYVLGTDAFVYHNVSVAVEPDEGLSVRFGVSNVLDEEPPFVTELSGEFNSTIGNVPVVSNYDFFGRTVFLNVTKTF